MQSQVVPFLLLFIFYQNVDSTEFIYPAAPFLARRAGANGTTKAEDVTVINSKGCDCQQLEILTTSEAVRRKHGELLGQYQKLEDIPDGQNGLYNGRPGYVHSSGNFFLYYNSASQGFWAIGETMGSEVVRLENQGDRMCPYYLKSIWRYADGDLNALVYDVTLRTVCMHDPCSVAHCGHQARCVLLDPQPGSNSTKPKASCECKEGYKGDPYQRCIPTIKSTDDCKCDRLIFSTTNPMAKDKHENSYGEYFLFDHFENAPVYQHFAGIEYLYRRDGHWLVSDKIGLHEAGMQNQGDGDITCPYLFRTHWEYADVEQPGWQWVYDYTARLVCPNDPCSMTKCGFHATCKVDNAQAVCSCDAGYEGNPYTRCYPKPPVNCDCLTLDLTSSGPSALAQSDKMGSYHLFGYFNQKPAYQHDSGLDYLYFAEGDAWVIGASFGGSRVGIVNFDTQSCPFIIRSVWRHSVSGKLEKDTGISVTCTDPRPLLNAARITTTEAPDLDPAPSINQQVVPNNSIERIDVVTPTPTTTYKPNITNFESTICNCYMIEVTSQNAATAEKHGSQLGTYRLIDVQAGRPVYKHESEEQYMYYHPYSGGNWLINTEIGLLYGGIQNSKDVPVCPYLINTMWQYGDSDMGGWIYDASLKVTCPTDPCSVLKCGFRALCVLDPQPRCICRDGFEGDPNLRCYPREVDVSCACKEVLLSSSGPSKEHQRDKMGEFFLWGFYNDRPVYQHVSGLDFLYYHKNHVWGVGPKVGGNSAGLLNFGRSSCPYKLVTPWEFGTKMKNKKRQMDPQLSLVCLDHNTKPRITTLKPSTARPSTRRPTKPSPLENESLLKCGKSMDDAPHPWQAQIQVSKNRMSTHACSGIILTEKHILTSASCLVNNPLKHYSLVVGQNDLDELDEWEEEFSVQSIFTHDDFNEVTGVHDIALVKLKKRRGKYISFESHFVQPICLPNKASQTNFAESCEVSGWGSWSEAAGMTLSGQSVNIDHACHDGKPSAQDNLICVENPSSNSQKDFTFDDGMPLTCTNRNRAFLRGLHAKKLDPCKNGCPMMKFLDISHYLDWINARLAL